MPPKQSVVVNDMETITTRSRASLHEEGVTFNRISRVSYGGGAGKPISISLQKRSKSIDVIPRFGCLDELVTGRLNGRTAGQPDSRTAGQPDSRTAGQPDSLAAGQPGRRAAGLPDSRAAGQPGCRTAGRQDD